LLNRIVHALALASLDPVMLCLEIAEQTLVDDLMEIAGVLRALRDLEVRLAIDDFGAGATSLALLREIPVDVLKLDQSFIRPLAGDQHEDQDIVAALTALAHRLGLTVTAEGIETSEHLDAVRRAGCDQRQGFLLGRPLPAYEVLDLLSRGTLVAAPVALWNATSHLATEVEPVRVVS